jgi:uncharacterized protein (UPF0332 family)
MEGIPVHGFMKKAQDNLALAKYCLENGHFDASANRAYYAAFQAAIAALSAQGITNEKYEHKWVQANFNRELIRQRKIYPSRISSTLLDMILVRNHADYLDEPMSKKRAARQLARAEDFVGLIYKELGL